MKSYLRIPLLVLIPGFMALLTLLPASAALVTRNFDELGEPVDCCFGSGAYNVVSYPDLTVSSGASAVVMTYLGWADMQTSGKNLYGTLDGYIDLTFSEPVYGLNFDIINGAADFSFTLNFYDILNNLIETDLMSLSSFSTLGSVGHAVGGVGNIAKVRILGNEDFAIDTINFEIARSEVPEPGNLALFVLGALSLLSALAVTAQRQSEANLHQS